MLGFAAQNVPQGLGFITCEELTDGVELAGLSSYLGDAEGSDVNLFM